MKKDIALCMFFRNEENYIFEALNSILNQTFKDYDLLILDDASTDNSYELIKKIISNDPRIKYERNKIREGYGYCYKYLFKTHAKNYKYMAWISGHDVYEKNWLEECYKIIQKDNNISVVYPKNDRIDENSNFIRDEARKFSADDDSIYLRLKALLNSGTNFGQIIYGLFDVKKVLKAGITRSLNLADTVLIWELAIFGKIVQLDKKLWHFRFDYFKGDKSPKAAKNMANRQLNNRFAKPPFYLKISWPLLNSLTITSIYLFKINCGIRQKIAGIICGIFYLIKYRKYI